MMSTEVVTPNNLHAT